MTKDSTLQVACLRWHTAQQHRLEAGAELRKIRIANRGVRALLQTSEINAIRRVTEAKRAERAALRKLATLCAAMRSASRQAGDALDVVAKLNF